jgi:outer membrane lipoprotein carrier protein
LRAPFCRFIACASLTLFGASAFGAAPAASAAAQVEKYLDGLASWSADFSQTISDSRGKAVRAASGHLYIQRPGKFRWNYVQPSEQVILTDGKKLWFYDKDLAQANVRDLDASIASSPAVLLSGGASVSDEFEISARDPADGLEWFQLKPKHSDGDFLAVRIGFRKGELTRMLLADKLNQVTRVDFSNSVRNAKFAPDLFSFVPPPGVDVIGRSGSAP